MKKFAHHMVEDHSRMLEEQETMAQSKAVSLPKAPAKAEKAVPEVQQHLDMARQIAAKQSG